MFQTSPYRKPTFSDQCLNFLSFNLISHKVAVFSTYIYRAFHLCSDEILFYLEIKRNLNDLLSNGYPSNWVKHIYHRILCPDSFPSFSPPSPFLFRSIYVNNLLIKNHLFRYCFLELPLNALPNY